MTRVASKTCRAADVRIGKAVAVCLRSRTTSGRAEISSCYNFCYPSCCERSSSREDDYEDEDLGGVLLDVWPYPVGAVAPGASSTCVRRSERSMSNPPRRTMAEAIKAGIDSVDGCEGILYQVSKWGGQIVCRHCSAATKQRSSCLLRAVISGQGPARAFTPTRSFLRLSSTLLIKSIVSRHKHPCSDALPAPLCAVACKLHGCSLHACLHDMASGQPAKQDECPCSSGGGDSAGGSP